jgi:four helix bundle protein
LNHVNIALGSQAEVETQLKVALRLGHVASDDSGAIVEDLARVGQMLHGLPRKLVAARTIYLVTLGVLAGILIAPCIP